MRKIFYSLLLLLAVSLLVACSDKENTPPGYREHNLSVVSQNVAFSAIGGEGEMIVNSGNPISAKAESHGDWVSLNVQDNTIKVTTNTNSSLGGSSSRILISSGPYTTSATVQQLGLAMKLGHDKASVNKNAATDVSMVFTNSNPIEVSSDNGWVTRSSYWPSVSLGQHENLLS